MIVHGLSSRGEASIKLHPTGRADQYLRRVREMLAGHTLSVLRAATRSISMRWTRMGQARDKGLDCLLLLGEAEAVVSVAYSNGLTDELARRAWWAMPTADNARRMLERDCVAQGKMGKSIGRISCRSTCPSKTNPHIDHRYGPAVAAAGVDR